MRRFGLGTHLRQTCAIAGSAFGSIAKSAASLVALAAAVFVIVLLPALIALRGVSLLPRTAYILTFLAAPVADNPRLPWVLIPLLVVFYAGELVWRERDAGLGELADTMPVPEWVLFLGKFLGLSLGVALWMALATLTSVLGQMRMDYFDVEIGLYLRILFGLQLIDYLLFALLVFVVHAVVNQKQTGYLIALIAYGVLVFPSAFGLEHRLLIYGSSPRWTYSDMRGFGASLGPWLWFKLYWAAWAVLLAVAGKLLWVRGTERGVRLRLQAARRRFTGATIGVAATAVGVIVSLGGFIFYNTNSLNRYRTASEETARQAEYERRYAKYAAVARPTVKSTNLRIEIYPDERKADIRGIYTLANTGTAAIESIHVTTAPAADYEGVSVDRPASPVLVDDDLGYRIYQLEKPLQPGDSLRFTFEIHVAPHGFGNHGVDAFIVPNGSRFTNLDWFPAIGYQRNRELEGAGVRRQHQLAGRPAAPSLDDAEARRIRAGGDLIDFDAIVGTSENQVAVAPGLLRRRWTEGGRRYFHYVTNAPVNNQYAVFSAQYAVHEAEFRFSPSSPPVAIQIFHHPRHAENVKRMVASVRPSLRYYTEQYGPYPYSYIRLIENPGGGMGVATEAATIAYGEGFTMFHPGKEQGDLDPIFAVIAHAVGRGWWGMQVAPADVEGARLLDVGLETYSGMRVVATTSGHEQLRRYVLFLRQDLSAPHPRARPPLLRSTDSFSASRKAPLALYAIGEYIGEWRVDNALRSLFRKHRFGVPPLPTSMDLYRELQAVTPDDYQYLLRDLFEKNTFWELETERAMAKRTSAGAWEVKLELRARKVAIDEAGIETEVPMDDWVQVGVFGGGAPHMEKHRIRSGRQTITLTVASRPTRAGLDPENLLIDLETENNLRDVQLEN